MVNTEDTAANVEDGDAASTNPPDSAPAEDYSVPADAAGRFAVPIRILTLSTAFFMFAIVALTFVDVAGRYVFNRPVPGGIEFIEFLLGLLIFSALPLVTVKRAHITVELFDGFMSDKFKRIREIVVLVVSAGMIAFITERMWSTGLDMLEGQDVSEHLEIPTAPILFALTALSIVSTIVQLYMVWKYITVDFAAGVVPGQHHDQKGEER
ncbi:MAG: TRAP transporter small permease [Proteobacteria bacterium]|nr:TRAP transporter small permease [Pseudomonadota bacterium]